MSSSKLEYLRSRYMSEEPREGRKSDKISKKAKKRKSGKKERKRPAKSRHHVGLILADDSADEFPSPKANTEGHQRRTVGGDAIAPSPPPARIDSDSDASVPRAPPARADSDSDASVPRQPPVRVDSDSDASPPRHQVQNGDDSDSDVSVPRPPRKRQRGATPEPDDSDDSDAPVPRRPERALSGATAGLQSADAYRVEQQSLQRARAERLAKLDNDVRGEAAGTTFRDKSGRVVDVVEEHRQKQAREEQKKAAEEVSRRLWNLGAKQKEEVKARKRELDKAADTPFARSADDPELEEARKADLREGDPMAEFMAAKEEAAVKTRPEGGKPKYAGPTPPPNRFGIAPGYRWDGVDRSNGFEQKLLSK